MIIPPILTTSLIRFSFEGSGECTFRTWEWKGWSIEIFRDDIILYPYCTYSQREWCTTQTLSSHCTTDLTVKVRSGYRAQFTTNKVTYQSIVPLGKMFFLHYQVTTETSSCVVRINENEYHGPKNSPTLRTKLHGRGRGSKENFVLIFSPFLHFSTHFSSFFQLQAFYHIFHK